MELSHNKVQYCAHSIRGKAPAPCCSASKVQWSGMGFPFRRGKNTWKVVGLSLSWSPKWALRIGKSGRFCLQNGLHFKSGSTLWAHGLIDNAGLFLATRGMKKTLTIPIPPVVLYVLRIGKSQQPMRVYPRTPRTPQYPRICSDQPSASPRGSNAS